VTVLAVILIFAVAVCLFFRVTEICVEGDAGDFDVDAIIEVSGIKKGQSIVMVRRSEASHAIQSTFPALSSASVSVRLPGIAVIKVNESHVRATLSCQGKSWVFDENGHVISEAEIGKQYLRVTGLEILEAKIGQELSVEKGKENALSYTKTILTQLEERNLYADVSTLSLENLANIEFCYKDSFTVKLGSGMKLEYKLEKFASAIEKIQEEGNHSGTIDLSEDGKTYYTP